MQTETILFEASDWVPNNPDLPVLLYRQAFADETDLATAFQERFAENGWRDCWRNGVFSYQHYHTRAHEVLGIARGHARLLIGGAGGRRIDVSAGDCIVLPAGTGHCRISADPNFLVVGAYPPNQDADIKTDAADQTDLQTIRAVPSPSADPIEGNRGFLTDAWRIDR
jgi:uncharacterized protein YjlB